MPYHEVLEEIRGITDGALSITAEEYMLGLADLTGELMRYCINIISKRDHEAANSACQTIRGLANDFGVMDFPLLKKKIPTLQSSLLKVENGTFLLVI